MKQLSNALLVLAAAAIFLCGLCKTIFFPKQYNLYENRYANQLSAFTISGYQDSSFQDTVEDALSDQINLAQTMKQTYNTVSNKYLSTVVNALLERHPDTYISLGELELFNGYLTYPTFRLSSMTESLDLKADNLNQCFSDHPDVDFYVYYIEKDCDIDFETDEKSGISDYILDQLQLPASHKDIFRTNSFEPYSEEFYSTDHHWNYKGSYQGYLQLRSLLGITEPAIEPTETVTLPESFSGSKAMTIGAQAIFSEAFTAYVFDYPSMSITIDGEAVEDYGSCAAFLDGSTALKLSYGNFYGGDEGEVIFDTGSDDRDNILILGDSYDNAILKLLASHFGRTYSVDLRYYEHSMDRSFQLAEYLEAHDIQKVLLLGSVSYFTKEDFYLED